MLLVSKVVLDRMNWADLKERFLNKIIIFSHSYYLMENNKNSNNYQY